MAEALNSLDKAQLIRDRKPWTGINAVEIATAEHTGWFNQRRLHGQIGHVTSAGFEADYRATAHELSSTETDQIRLHQTRRSTHARDSRRDVAESWGIASVWCSPLP